MSTCTVNNLCARDGSRAAYAGLGGLESSTSMLNRECSPAQTGDVPFAPSLRAPQAAPVVDPALAEIVHRLTPAGRATLISLLGELFNVLDNLDTLCDQNAPGCRRAMTFERLRTLLHQLNTQ